MSKKNLIKKQVNKRASSLALYAERLKRHLEKQKQVHSEAFTQALEQLDLKKLHSVFGELVNNIELTKATLGIMGQSVPISDADGSPTYVVSSRTLFDWYDFLKRMPEEDLFFVTGLEHDGFRFLQLMTELKMATRSTTTAEADFASMTMALLEMDRFGHRFLAHVHSHPFDNMGKEGTQPSAKDIAYQQSLESGEYPTIGLIFSREKFVRFFSVGKPFNVKIYGKGVEQIEDKVFRLVEPT